jgi:hypothetical protein
MEALYVPPEVREARAVREVKVRMATTAMSPVAFAHQENTSAIS